MLMLVHVVPQVSCLLVIDLKDLAVKDIRAIRISIERMKILASPAPQVDSAECQTIIKSYVVDV